MSATIFDIETAPMAADELALMMPVFHPAKNLKDPVKIEADVAAKKAAWIDDAALSALTGRVLAIGILRGEEPEIAHGNDEAANIQWFWDLLPELGQIAGFNVANFDLPFLVRRSWKLGIGVPPIRDGRRWLNVVDLREVWGLGEHHPDGTLDQIARHLGLPGKTESGKQFYEAYSDNADLALDYLKNDLILTKGLLGRMRA